MSNHTNFKKQISSNRVKNTTMKLDLSSLSLVQIEEEFMCNRISLSQANDAASILLEEKMFVPAMKSINPGGPELLSENPEELRISRAEECFERYAFGRDLRVNNYDAWIRNSETNQLSRVVFLSSASIRGAALIRAIYVVRYNQDNTVKEDVAVSKGVPIGRSYGAAKFLESPVLSLVHVAPTYSDRQSAQLKRNLTF